MIVSLPYLQHDVPFDIFSLNVNLTPTTSAAITATTAFFILVLMMWRCLK